MTKQQDIRAALWRFKAAIALGDSQTELSRRVEEIVQMVAPSDEPGAKPVEPFVVKHYATDLRPTIKGNGFDGLEVGIERQNAQEFIDWINARVGVNQQARMQVRNGPIDKLPCDHCGHGIDEHLQPGLLCPPENRPEDSP